MASSAIKDFEKTEKGCYNEIDFLGDQIVREYIREKIIVLLLDEGNSIVYKIFNINYII